MNTTILARILAWLRSFLLRDWERSRLKNYRVMESAKEEFRNNWLCAEAGLKACQATLKAAAGVTPHERAVLAGLREPMRWAPEPSFTREEVETIEKFVASDLGRKIDAALHNRALLGVQEASRGDVAHETRTLAAAYGRLSLWYELKNFPQMFGAKSEQAEDAETKGNGPLEQLRP